MDDPAYDVDFDAAFVKTQIFPVLEKLLGISCKS
jgi:hypothetical protein